MSSLTATVVIADADSLVVSALSAPLAAAHFELLHVADDKGLLLAMQKRVVDIVCIDVDLPTQGGFRLLNTMNERWPDVPVLLLSARGGVADAVEAIKAGASDFAAKPLDAAEFVFALNKLRAQGPKAADEPPPASTVAGTRILGRSQAMREVLELVQRAASGNATVLVRGESGTGKELLARRVHDFSARRAGPFVKVHSAALPEQLLESELFGYEKGAFTGANSRKPGRVELAQGGTLFLDEIGDISAATQVKLLRVLQEREYERLGGTETLKANVRFVAATHKDLEAMVQQGTFREDLYYRLNVIPIVAPSLRERPEDIPDLVRHFAVTVSTANDRPPARIDEATISAMAEYDWPGNVRQLQNFIERLVVLADGPDIALGVVRRELARLRALSGGKSVAPAAASVTKQIGELSLGMSVLDLDEAVRRAERSTLEKALTKASGNRTVAARILGVSRRTLYNKLAEHGLG